MFPKKSSCRQLKHKSNALFYCFHIYPKCSVTNTKGTVFDPLGTEHFLKHLETRHLINVVNCGSAFYAAIALFYSSFFFIQLLQLLVKAFRYHRNPELTR